MLTSEMPVTGRTPDLSSFRRDGYCPPFRLLSTAQCEQILRHLRYGHPPAPMRWFKGRAATDRVFYDVATHPVLLELLRSVLGPDFVLWGASVVQRAPGQTHWWHVDMESAAADKCFASVWIGLENTSAESALLCISRSHVLPKSVDQTRYERGLKRDQVSDETVLGWAREYDPLAALVHPDVADGDAIIFDGRLWHGSHNLRQTGARVTLLLQYAAADAPVFILDPKRLEWPYRLTEERAPCVLISGRALAGVNTIVPPPPPDQRPPVLIATEIRSVPLPLKAPDGSGGTLPLFRGATPILDCIECQISVLEPRQTSHPLHAHPQDEILFPLLGTASLLISDNTSAEGARVAHVRPGSFAYCPAYRHHAIRNLSDAPITYLLLNCWRGARPGSGPTLGTRVFDYAAVAFDRPNPIRMRLLFEHTTSYLGKLHAHVTELEPAAGYPPHADRHDVLILLLAGAVEIAGRIVKPFAAAYHAAGEAHGIRNIGSTVARYVVFEFHRLPTGTPGTIARSPAAAAPAS
jgi:hypothetical protein